MIIQFDGTRYKGWQKQNHKEGSVTTIQGKLESVLSKMTGENIEVIGCGRTDSGVHADNYVANFQTLSQMTIEAIEEYLLEYLPEDIVIKEIRVANERFHSRYNAKEKTYCYLIHNLSYRDVFNKRFTHHVPEKLNIEEMRKAVICLIGTHDFKSFTNLKGKKERSTVRNINYINITEDDGLVKIEVNGNSFLFNMVRIIVGTLIEVGNGTKKASEIEDILSALDRDKAGHKAPAKGLTLKELLY